METSIELTGAKGSLYSFSLRLGKHLCHQLDERSFHRGIRKYPVCARCTGIYVGLIPAVILYLLLPLPLWLYILLALPMTLDGAIQLFTRYRSTNPRRFITGLIFSIPYGALMVFSVIWLIECISSFG